MRKFESFFRELLKYKQTHGDCLVPYKYVTEEGRCLGKTVSRIRGNRIKLDESEIERLNQIGFVWKVKSVVPFKKIFELLLEYKKEYGDYKVSLSYVTSDGIKFGEIVKNIRTGRKKVSAKEKQALDEIGFIWAKEKNITFDEIFELLLEYKKEFGNCAVPLRYVTADGTKLGWNVFCIRSGRRKLSEVEKQKLNEIDFCWGVVKSFEQIYKMILDYKKTYGNCLIPQRYITADGIRLGIAVSSIRSGNRKVSEAERKMLDEIGFVWATRKVTPFEKVIELLLEYKKENGDCKVPKDYITKDGVRIGDIVHNIRCGARKTTVEQKKQLDDIGFIWNPKEFPVKKI